MPTLRLVTVKPSGGDYSSLAAALAAEAADLVALDRRLDIACYAMQDGPAVVSGFTTDATRYVRIYTPPTERHAGSWNAAKYHIVPAGVGYALVLNCAHVRVEGLQISSNPGSAYAYGVVQVGFDVALDPAASDVRITECLLRDAPDASVTYDGAMIASSGTVTLRNCVVVSTTRPAVYTHTYGSLAVALDNCTLIGATSGVFQDNQPVTLQNCYVHGGTVAYDGTFTRTTCAHSSATSYPGSTANVAHSTANFVSVTYGSEDYHLVPGSALIGAGTDLSGTFTTDVDGDTRSAPWDIGADQYGATDTTPPTLGTGTVAAGGTSLTATLSESGCTPASGTGGFTLGGTSATVATWAISGTTLTLTLAGVVYASEAVTLSYSRGTTTDDIADAAGNFLVDFSAAAVTNSSTRVAPHPSGPLLPEGQIAMLKNTADQKLYVFAYSVVSGLIVPKTADAANLSASVAKDYATPAALFDTSATEVSSTLMPGFYLFDLTQAETNADRLAFAAGSATSGVSAIAVPAVLDTIAALTSVPANIIGWKGSPPNDLVAGKVDANATASLGATAPANWINAAALDPDVTTEVQAGLATAAALSTVGTTVAAVRAKTDNLPGSPAAVGSAMTLADGAITSAKVTVAAYTGVAPGWIERVEQVWRRFFRPASRTPTQLRTFADNGTTTMTTQAISDDGSGTETQGGAA